MLNSSRETALAILGFQVIYAIFVFFSAKPIGKLFLDSNLKMASQTGKTMTSEPIFPFFIFASILLLTMITFIRTDSHSKQLLASIIGFTSQLGITAYWVILLLT